MKKLLTAKELAEMLQVQTVTIKRWTKQGRIKGYRVGKNFLRYDYDEVLDVIKKPVEK